MQCYLHLWWYFVIQFLLPFTGGHVEASKGRGFRTLPEGVRAKAEKLGRYWYGCLYDLNNFGRVKYSIISAKCLWYCCTRIKYIDLKHSTRYWTLSYKMNCPKSFFLKVCPVELIISLRVGVCQNIDTNNGKHDELAIILTESFSTFTQWLVTCHL